MKRIFLAISMMALAINSALADDNNYLYIDDMVVTAGKKEAVISVKMKNVAEIQTIGVFVTLPEGVKVVENDGDLQIELSTARTRATRHSLSSNLVDGTYRIGILGIAGKAFSGNDDEVFTMTVNIPDTMETGDYDIELSQINLTDLTDVPYNTPSLKYKMTVTNYATAIHNMAVNADDATVYSVTGQTMPMKQRGMNIVRTKNGDVVKVAVK